MEEPKKVMRVEYVGMLQVEKPSGMEVINTAIDRVAEENPRPWKQVSVAVAPSTVTVTNTVSIRCRLSVIWSKIDCLDIFIFSSLCY